MNPADFKRVVEEDRLLKVGDIVVVLWTVSGHQYAGRGKITKLNVKSLRAKLIRPVSIPGAGEYPVGREIVVPRAMSANWTWRNRAQVSAIQGSDSPTDTEMAAHLLKDVVGDPGQLKSELTELPRTILPPNNPKEWAEWLRANGKWTKLHDAIAYAYVLGWYAKNATTDDGKYAAVQEAFKVSPELRLIAEKFAGIA